ncbi:hypothetical protein L1887_08024 [Cichorium endivia]|nr:hypothetical protein L1887_08024 [Cichorium endivia]
MVNYGINCIYESVDGGFGTFFWKLLELILPALLLQIILQTSTYSILLPSHVSASSSRFVWLYICSSLDLPSSTSFNRSPSL